MERAKFPHQEKGTYPTDAEIRPCVNSAMPGGAEIDTTTHAPHHYKTRPGCYA